MALGELVNEERGQISGVRIISSDVTGTTSEISLRTEGTIRGTRQVSNWTYEQIKRPDGSLYGYGRGVMTTENGDVVNLTGSGSAKVPTGGKPTLYRVVNHYHTTSEKLQDLNYIAVVGEYDVSTDGSTEGRFWEWK
jgi:hypothetical protein